MRISTKSAAFICFIFLIFFVSFWNDFTSQLFQKFYDNLKNINLENGEIKPTTESPHVENVTTPTPKSLSNPASYIKLLVSKMDDETHNFPSIVPDTEKSEDLFPPTWTLGHISMQYVMNNDICNSTHHVLKNESNTTNPSRNEARNREIFAVILIRSFAAHKGIRNKIRQALPTSKLEKLGMRRVFVLAQPPKFTIDWEAKSMVAKSEVEQENNEHKDIIMGNFTDTFMHSTYKHLMALQWALRYCSDAKYIFHHEDDFLVDLYQLRFKLNKNLRAKLKDNFMKMDPDLLGSDEKNDNDTFTDERKASFFLGYLNEGHLPTQNSSRVWENWMRMRREFPGEYKFPNHVSGGAYVTNMKTAKEIISVSEKIPFYFMDDIHVTGSLREGATKKGKAPIPIFNIYERFTYNATWLTYCVAFFPEFWCPFYFGHGYVSAKVLKSFHQHGEYCYRRLTCRERTVSLDPST